MPKKMKTIRLSDEGWERLKDIAPDYPSETAAIEDAIERLMQGRLAFGRHVWQATDRLIATIQQGDEAAEGGALMELATLLHSLPAAQGIASAIRERMTQKENDDEDERH